MCEYCEKEKNIFERDEICNRSWGWGGDTKIAIDQMGTYTLGCFIDKRGYLRLADLDDCDCLDHGDSIQIKFCPFCGKKV